MIVSMANYIVRSQKRSVTYWRSFATHKKRAKVAKTIQTVGTKKHAVAATPSPLKAESVSKALSTIRMVAAQTQNSLNSITQRGGSTCRTNPPENARREETAKLLAAICSTPPPKLRPIRHTNLTKSSGVVSSHRIELGQQNRSRPSQQREGTAPHHQPRDVSTTRDLSHTQTQTLFPSASDTVDQENQVPEHTEPHSPASCSSSTAISKTIQSHPLKKEAKQETQRTDKVVTDSNSPSS